MQHHLLFLLLVSLFVFSPLAYAELPPEVYADDQRNAGEALTIHVKTVNLEWCFFNCDSRRVTAVVEITAVTRTSSKLKTGDTITIVYQHNKLEGSGPSPIPILKEGQTRPAWLDKDSTGHYHPTAGGMSFSQAIDLPIPKPLP